MNIVHTIRLVTSAAAAIAEVRKYEGSIVGVAQTVEKHANTLSGDKLLKSANEWTAAVAKLGGASNGLASQEQILAGASKLNATEKERLNRLVTEAISKYQLLGKTAPQAMIELRDATKKAVTEVEKQPTMMDRVSTKAVAMGAAFGTFLGGMAWSAVNKLGAEMSVFVQRGTELPALQSAFTRLSNGVKADADTMLSGMQKASRGLVSEYDLMKAANKAMLLGLPVTSESMGTLTKAATTLGRAMGMDATQSVDDLVTALGRSSPMILDNLGLTVKVGEANEIYAQKLGKTAEQLTDAEKKTAFYNEAMRKAKQKTQELGEQTLTLSEYLGILWTSVGNKVSSGVGSLNVATGSVVGGLGQAVKTSDSFFGSIKKGALGATFDLLGFGRTTDQVSAIMSNSGAATDRASKAKADFVAQLAKMRSELTALTPATIAQFKAADELGKNDTELSQIIRLTETHVGLLKTQLSASSTQMKASSADTRKLADDIQDLDNKIVALGADGVPAAQIVERLGKEAVTARDRAQELGRGFDTLPPKINDVALAYTIWTANQKIAADDAKLIPGIVAKNVQATEAWVNARSKAESDILAKARTTVSAIVSLNETEYETKIRAAADWRDQVLRDIAILATKEPAMHAAVTSLILAEYAKRAAAAEAAQRVAGAPMILVGINAAVAAAKAAGATSGGGFADAFAKAVSNLGSIIVGAIQGGGNVAKAALASIGGSLGEDLGKSITKSLTASLGKGLATAIGGIMGPLGALVGSQVGGVVDRALDWLVSGGDQRRVATAFAATFGGLDGLQKQLKQLPEGERLWKSFMQALVANGNVPKAIKEIQDAMQGVRMGISGSGFDNMQTQREIPGFPTRAQLQQVAREAEETYRYIKDSGLYTAAQVDQAFDEWQESLIAAGDKGAAALKKIDAEIQGLQASVDAEAWEEEMGSIEKAERARLEALKAEKAAALVSIEEQKTAAQVAADAAELSVIREFDTTVKKAKELDSELTRIFKDGYLIPIRFTVPGLPGGGGTPPGNDSRGAQTAGVDYEIDRPTAFMGGNTSRGWAPFGPSSTGTGAGVSVSFGDVSVRSDRDIDEIARKVIRAIPRRYALEAGRR